MKNYETACELDRVALFLVTTRNTLFLTCGLDGFSHFCVRKKTASGSLLANENVNNNNIIIITATAFVVFVDGASTVWGSHAGVCGPLAHMCKRRKGKMILFEGSDTGSQCQLQVLPYS